MTFFIILLIAWLILWGIAHLIVSRMSKPKQFDTKPGDHYSPDKVLERHGE